MKRGRQSRNLVSTKSGEDHVELVLNALGHPETLVTDLSTIGDFGLEDDERCAASAKLGVTLSDDDYVCEIVRRLRD